MHRFITHKKTQQKALWSFVLAFFAYWVLVGAAHGAVKLTSEAELSYHSTFNESANGCEVHQGRCRYTATATVLRLDHIAFYRHDEAATAPFDIASGSGILTIPEGYYASHSSLKAEKPEAKEPLPKPILPQAKQPLDLSSVPLSHAMGYEFQDNEPLFIVAHRPIVHEQEAINEARFGQHQGQRFFAVTVHISEAEDISLTLMESTPGSGIYVGYLQPNRGEAPIRVPANSELTIDYVESGLVHDTYGALSAAKIKENVINHHLNERSTRMHFSAPISSELYVEKHAHRHDVMHGDFVAFDLRLENRSDESQNDVMLYDQLPVGLRYQKGSFRMGDTHIEPNISADGRLLSLPIGTLKTGDSLSFRYVVEVTVNAAAKSTNKAYATSLLLRSHEASDTLRVQNPFFNDHAFLLGRVIAGECGDHEGEGIPNVRIYLEDGTYAVTDEEGRWHIEGVAPGTHVLQLDTDTLTPRFSLQECPHTSRSAGNPISRFVNVQGGTLWRENWYLAAKEPVDSHLEQRLTSEVVNQQLNATIHLKNGETLFKQLQTTVELPYGVEVDLSSVKLDNKPINAIQQGAQLRLESFPEGYYWKQQITFAATLNELILSPQTVTLSAHTRGTTLHNHEHLVSSLNLIHLKPAEVEVDEIELRPNFSSMSAELSHQDKQEINKVINALQRLSQRSTYDLIVTGHTDNQAIRPNPNREINDNYTLSLARAQAVADYLAQALSLKSDQIQVEGKGPDEPIATNSTAAGRALNRRVALKVAVSTAVRAAGVEVKEGDSGLSIDAQTQQELEDAKPKPGFVGLDDEPVFLHPRISLITQINENLKPRLLVNGKEISNRRIGSRIFDEEHQLVRHTWIGVELEHTGDHEIEIQGLDGFGIERYSETITVRRSAPIKTIRVAKILDNTADGRSPVGVKLDILDDFDRPVRTGVNLHITEGELQAYRHADSHRHRGLERKQNQLQVDKDGIAWFDPVNEAGTYRIRLSDGGAVSETLEIPVNPDLRDWILVGFAEGSVGYNRLHKNKASLHSQEEHFYTDGDASFFARGRVKGEWLLTAAYDSRRNYEDTPHRMAINPEQWYTLYGDNTRRGHDAASREKLYVRMEKRDFYALFGDYDTGLTTTELTHFQRSLTGAKSEWNGRNASTLLFVAESDSGFIRDDIAADGTSGLYRLSRQRIVPGSESIEIQVRDRFTNEIVDRTEMTRFADYSLDTVDGTFFFREPIPTQDSAFNPIRIVVRYEVDQDADQLVAGGRVTFHDADKKLVTGINVINDESVNGTLSGADVTWKPNNKHTVKAELANSKDSINDNKSAWLLEHSYTSEKLDTHVRADQTEGHFGLGNIQQNSSHVARDDMDERNLITEGRYRVNEKVAISGQASRQEIISTNDSRNLAESRVEYSSKEWQAFGGARYVEDTRGKSVFQSKQVTAGGHRYFMERRLKLSAQGETSIDDSEENADYPRRVLGGADYQLTQKVNVFANQEFTWGHERKTQDTRVGVKATPWQGGTVSSDVSHGSNEYGPRTVAHAGLFQTIEINGHWSADFGLDRSETIRGQSPQENIFDPTKPLSSGSIDDDYTAVSAGVGYRDAVWQWTNRAEYRHGNEADKYNYLTGLSKKLNDTDTLLARFLHFDQRYDNGNVSRSSEVDLSYVRRPLNDSWYLLNRTSFIYDEDIERQSDAPYSLKGHRWVNNTVANWTWRERHQLSAQYGARYVLDTIDQERYSGYSDLIGGEYRYDITQRFDIGVRGSTLASWNSRLRKNSVGVMAGYSPMHNVWLSLGYNFIGFYDRDFVGANARMEGVVLDFRIKFDQNSVRRQRSHGENE